MSFLDNLREALFGAAKTASAVGVGGNSTNKADKEEAKGTVVESVNNKFSNYGFPRVDENNVYHDETGDVHPYDNFNDAYNAMEEYYNKFDSNTPEGHYWKRYNQTLQDVISNNDTQDLQAEIDAMNETPEQRHNRVKNDEVYRDVEANDSTQNLEAEIQAYNDIYGNGKKESKAENAYDLDEMAGEFILGAWGNGQDRIDNLLNAGFSMDDYNKIQNRVNAAYANNENLYDLTNKANEKLRYW